MFLGIGFIYNIITTLTCQSVYLLSAKLVVYQRRIGKHKVDYRAVVTLLDNDYKSNLRQSYVGLTLLALNNEENTMLGRIPPTKRLQTVSVLVPTYMEKNNIANLIESINKNLSGYTFEVVVIDDNSPDGTADVVRRLTKDYAKTKLIVRSSKMGLGSAYRDGFNASSYEYIVEMDADMSHNPQEITKLLQSLNQDDIVIGSRYIQGGNIVGWNWRRKLISWGANRFARAVLGLKPKDVTSGFRVYSKGAFEKIITQSKLNGYAFQIEILYLAAKFGFKVKEVPITFNERKKGKSKLGTKEIFSFAAAMVSLKFRRVKVD